MLTRNEELLSIRAFTDNQRREVYEKQDGLCSICGEPFEINEMEADHIKSWYVGGRTITKNCQMLCKKDHKGKSNGVIQ